MKRTLVIPLLLGALLASAAVNLYHAMGTGGQPAGIGESTQAVAPDKSLCPPLEELGLTASQREKLSGCCGMCRARRDELRERIAALTTQLEEELNATPVDAERVLQLADQIGDLRAQELKSRVHSIVQVKETLTASQLERLVAAVKEPFAVPEGTKEKGE